MLQKLFKYFETLIDFRDHQLSRTLELGSIRLVLRLLKPFKPLVIAAALTGMLLTCIELARLWSISWLVDAVAYSSDLSLSADHLIIVWVLIATYMLVDPAVWLLNYLLRMQSLRSQTRSSALWQSHKAATRHDLDYFSGEHAGQVAGRINQVSVAVQNCAEILAGRFPLGFVRFLGSAFLVAYLAPVFIAPVLLWIILNGLFAVWLAPKVNEQATRIAETTSSVNGAITEYFSNIRSIKTYFAYDLENAYVLSKIKDQNQNNLAINRLTTTTGLYIRILNTGLVSLVLALGVYGLSVKILTPGEFVAGITLATGMAADAGWFVSIWEGVTQALGAVKDARTTIEPRPLIEGPEATSARFTSPPDIRFNAVEFSYRKDAPVIRQASFTIPGGSKFAIVGPSGAGKSTMVNLLLRHYDTTSGSITFNGDNIRKVPLEKLRAAFAVVSQGDALFHRSIKDNIAFGCEDAAFDEIRQAARKANADVFIENLIPDDPHAGYELVVGDRGARLSGGQQQRILLARAFLQRRPVLLLDEATSALDSQSEAMIQAAVDAHSASTTIIAIAHRLSTIRFFDQIAVMRDGEIEAVGTHSQLLETSPLYAGLWDTQMGGPDSHNSG